MIGTVSSAWRVGCGYRRRCAALALAALVVVPLLGAAPYGTMAAAGTGTVAGRVFVDTNRSGAPETGEVAPTQEGPVIFAVFVDANGNLAFDSGEVYTLTDAATGAYTLANVAAGAQRLCRTGSGLVGTTPRCQTLTISAGNALGLDFGFAPDTTQCSGGRLFNTIIGLDPVGAPQEFSRPIDLPTLFTAGVWPYTRLLVQGTQVTVFAKQGERVLNALVVGGGPVDGAPNLVLRYTYQKSYQQVLSVATADGSVATNLGSGNSLPKPFPTTFSVFDKNGELYIFGVPHRPGAVSVITQPSRSSGFFTTTAAIAGTVKGTGSSTYIASLGGSPCGDTAGTRLTV